MRRAVLAVALLAGFSLIAGQPAIAGHITDTFEVTGENNLGVTFTACMRFNNPDPPGSGELTIDEFPTLGGSFNHLLTYRHWDLDADLHTFQAVTRGDDDAYGEFMVFGKFKVSGGGKLRSKIRGQSVHESGITTTFSGETNSACPGKTP